MERDLFDKGNGSVSIVGTPTPHPPPPPLIKRGEGRTFQKLSYLGVRTKFFARKGGKPEKGVDVEMGGCLFLLLYSSVRSHLHFRIFSLLS